MFQQYPEPCRCALAVYQKLICILFWIPVGGEETLLAPLLPNPENAVPGIRRTAMIKNDIICMKRQLSNPMFFVSCNIYTRSSQGRVTITKMAF